MRTGKLRRKALAFGLSALAAVGPSFGANAACLDIYLTTLREFQASPQSPPKRDTFKANEMFVLCVVLGQDAFVSIDDAPPKGGLERLYPNSFSHPGAKPAAARLTAGVTCFGTPDTFPLFHPKDEGTGTGKISVLATTGLEGHTPETEYTIPKSFSLQATCGPVMKTITQYRVAQ